MANMKNVINTHNKKIINTPKDNITRTLQEHYKNITRILQEHYKNITRTLQEHYKNITRTLQEHATS